MRRQGEILRPAVAHDHLRVVSALAARSATIQSFIHGIGSYLFGPPLCVERVFVSLQTLHPAFRARTYLWKKQKPVVRVVEWPHGLTNRPGYYDSPDYHVHSCRTEFWVQKLQQVQGHSCELYGKLRNEGYTDYLMVPLVFSDGTVNTFAIATKRQAGFRASREVMRGRIRAGHGEAIRAGILFADMHDFTGHASRLGRSATVQLLNTLFRLSRRSDRGDGRSRPEVHRRRCPRLLPGRAWRATPNPVAAIRAIRTLLGKLNDLRDDKGEPPIRHGIGLHFGEVVFGNIGSSERLDFTIIGEVVNVAARCAEETRTLEVGYLATGDFVTQFGVEAFVAIGARTLRGFTEPLALFALAEEAGRPRQSGGDDQGVAPGVTPRLSVASAANGSRTRRPFVSAGATTSILPQLAQLEVGFSFFGRPG